jgi:hypothetical protein
MLDDLSRQHKARGAPFAHQGGVLGGRSQAEGDPVEGAGLPSVPAEQPGVMLAQSIERWSLQDALSHLRRWRQRIGDGAPVG